jgi:hypothetical protein
MKVATAGNAIVEVTDLYETGTIVTGVLTILASSDVLVTFLQEHIMLIAVIRHKKY